MTCPDCDWMWERIQQLNKLWDVVEALDSIEAYVYNHEQQGTWNMEEVQAIARKAREQPTPCGCTCEPNHGFQCGYCFQQALQSTQSKGGA